MVTCTDTSCLFSLYGNDGNSSRAVAWTSACRTPMTLTALGEYELGNALRFAEYRKVISLGEATLFWAQFESDRVSGRLKVHVCNLADVVNEAKRLSASHTLVGGHRSFDIVQVAAAIRLKAKRFLTFDAHQKKLALAEGLEVPT